MIYREWPRFGITEIGMDFNNIYSERIYKEGEFRSENTVHYLQTDGSGHYLLKDINVLQDNFERYLVLEQYGLQDLSDSADPDYRRFMHMRIRPDGVIEMYHNNDAEEEADLTGGADAGGPCAGPLRQNHLPP